MYHQHPPISTNYLQIAADVEQMSNSRSSLISTSFRQFQNGLLFCLIPQPGSQWFGSEAPAEALHVGAAPGGMGILAPEWCPGCSCRHRSFAVFWPMNIWGFHPKHPKQGGFNMVQRFNQTKHSAWKLGRWTWHYPMDQSWNLNRIMRRQICHYNQPSWGFGGGFGQLGFKMGPQMVRNSLGSILFFRYDSRKKQGQLNKHMQVYDRPDKVGEARTSPDTAEELEGWDLIMGWRWMKQKRTNEADVTLKPALKCHFVCVKPFFVLGQLPSWWLYPPNIAAASPLGRWKTARRAAWPKSAMYHNSGHGS